MAADRPLTAMNGMLLFGWSAAIVFEVLRKMLEQIEASETPVGRKNA